MLDEEYLEQDQLYRSGIFITSKRFGNVLPLLKYNTTNGRLCFFSLSFLPAYQFLSMLFILFFSLLQKAQFKLTQIAFSSFLETLPIAFLMKPQQRLRVFWFPSSSTMNKNNIHHFKCEYFYHFRQKKELLVLKQYVIEKNSPSGGIEPPNFHITAERACRLRHRG